MNYTPNDLDIFPGFYESVLFNSDAEYDFNYNEKLDDPDNYVEKEVDFEPFTKEVCENITYLIGDMLGAESKFKEMSSPREYNFTTDKLSMEIDIDPEKVKAEILSSQQLREGFDKYLHEHYTSRSGFISFIENNIKDFFSCDGNTDYDVMMDYYLLTKIYDDSDVVKCQREREYTNYFEQLYEIANNALYGNMKEINQ